MSRCSRLSNEGNRNKLLLGKEFELEEIDLQAKQTFTVNKYNNNNSITINNTVTSNNISGSCSHINKYFDRDKLQ